MLMRLGHGDLAYRERGSGRPFLLLNGWPFGSAEYEDVLEVLSWSSRAIAVDIPGLGESAALPDANPASVADAVLYGFAKIGIDSLVLACTDVAGPVGFEILRKQPGMVAGALFFNTCLGLEGVVRPRYLDRGKTTVVDLLRPSRRLEGEIAALAGDGKAIPPDRMAQALANLDRPGRKRANALFEATLASPFGEYREILRRFQKPVSILWGAEDRTFSPWQFEAFRAVLPEAPADKAPGVGHYLGLEDPNRLTQALVDLGRRAWP